MQAANWDASLTATTSATNSSKSIELNWDISSFDDCGTPTKLQIRYNRDSTTPPDSGNPTDGIFLKDFPITKSDFNHIPLHANTDYAYTIYACSNNSCTSYCSSISNVTGTDKTDPEQWMTPGIESFTTETSTRVLDPVTYGAAGSPAVFRYYSGDHNGELGFFFNYNGGIYFTRTDGCTEWEDNWNDDSTWSGDCLNDAWTTPEQVMEKTTSGDYDHVSSPWVVPLDGGGLSLHWVTKDNVSSPTEMWFYRLDSSDIHGDDWGLECTDTTCNTTGCNTNDFCEFSNRSSDIEEILHSEDGNCVSPIGWRHTVAWDYMADEGWDPANETLWHLITGNTTSGITGCTSCSTSGGSSQLLVDWDTSSYSLLETLIGSDSCPTEVISTRHNPSITPYPIDEYKVYVKEGQTEHTVRYTIDNGENYEDESAIEFYFDDGTGGLGTSFSTGCIGDMSTYIFDDGTTKHEIMFFTPITSFSYSCFNDGSSTEYPGIIAAVLTN